METKSVIENLPRERCAGKVSKNCSQKFWRHSWLPKNSVSHWIGFASRKSSTALSSKLSERNLTVARARSSRFLLYSRISESSAGDRRRAGRRRRRRCSVPSWALRTAHSCDARERRGALNLPIRSSTNDCTIFSCSRRRLCSEQKWNVAASLGVRFVGIFAVDAFPGTTKFS